MACELQDTCFVATLKPILQVVLETTLVLDLICCIMSSGLVMWVILVSDWKTYRSLLLWCLFYYLGAFGKNKRCWSFQPSSNINACDGGQHYTESWIWYYMYFFKGTCHPWSAESGIQKMSKRWKDAATHHHIFYHACKTKLRLVRKVIATKFLCV